MDQHDPDLPTAPAAEDAHPALGRARWRPPAHRIRICTLDDCQANGGRELMAAISERLGVGVDERTADGSISFEALECVGMCGIWRSVTIDDEPVVGQDAVLRAVDRLLD